MNEIDIKTGGSGGGENISDFLGRYKTNAPLIRNKHLHNAQDADNNSSDDDSSSKSKVSRKISLNRLQIKGLAYLNESRLVQKWICASLEIEITMEIGDALVDGVLICRLMNRIQPSSIPKIHRTNSCAFLLMENINFFLSACIKMGVTFHELFTPIDLYERKNIPQVIKCLLVVGGIATKNGFEPPLYYIETQSGFSSPKRDVTVEEEEVEVINLQLEEKPKETIESSSVSEEVLLEETSINEEYFEHSDLFFEDVEEEKLENIMEESASRQEEEEVELMVVNEQGEEVDVVVEEAVEVEETTQEMEIIEEMGELPKLEAEEQEVEIVEEESGLPIDPEEKEMEIVEEESGLPIDPEEQELEIAAEESALPINAEEKEMEIMEEVSELSKVEQVVVEEVQEVTTCEEVEEEVLQTEQATVEYLPTADESPLIIELLEAEEELTAAVKSANSEPFDVPRSSPSSRPVLRQSIPLLAVPEIQLIDPSPRSLEEQDYSVGELQAAYSSVKEISEPTLDLKKLETLGKYVVSAAKIPTPKVSKYVYKPLPNDPIDRSLADFFNNRFHKELPPNVSPPKPIVRMQPPGRYRFANKVVNLKEVNGLVLVRVGGGWMKLTEFLIRCSSVAISEALKGKTIKTVNFSKATIKKIGTGPNEPIIGLARGHSTNSLLNGINISNNISLSKSVDSVPTVSFGKNSNSDGIGGVRGRSSGSVSNGTRSAPSSTRSAPSSTRSSSNSISKSNTNNNNSNTNSNNHSNNNSNNNSSNSSNNNNISAARSKRLSTRNQLKRHPPRLSAQIKVTSV